MNLLLIVLPILAFILLGVAIAPFVLTKLVGIATSKNRKRDALLALVTMVASPVLTLILLIYLELVGNANTDFDNTVSSGNILIDYIFSATLCFLVIGITARIAKFEGYEMVFWGALFTAFSVPVVLLFLGDPIYTWLGEAIWREAITARKIQFH